MTDRYTELKTILLAKRDDLRSAITTFELELREGTESSGDYVDQTQASDQRDLAVALSEMNREALAGVLACIDRLERGKYGICVDCNVEIPTNRLRAIPFALRCVRCEDQMSGYPKRTIVVRRGGLVGMFLDPR